MIFLVLAGWLYLILDVILLLIVIEDVRDMVKKISEKTSPVIGVFLGVLLSLLIPWVGIIALVWYGSTLIFKETESKEDE